MKVNLKNFPKTAEGENRDEADLWADSFEKELRDRIAKLETITGIGSSYAVFEKQTLMEILGE